MKLNLSNLNPAFERYSNDTIPNFNTPEDLLEFMSDFNYGWLDKYYKSHSGTGTDFYDYYAMLLPHEVVKYKIGVCWDQSVFEKYVFDTQFEFDEVKLIAQHMHYLDTHTYVCFRKGKEWFHFENSWGVHRGIHGPYRSVDEINSQVRKWNKEIHKKDFGAHYTDITNEDLYKKHSCIDFLKLMKYDFTKPEQLAEYVYHYIWNGVLLDKILEDGKLLPQNALRDPARLEDYASRTKSGNADDYFREAYSRFYEPVLKVPYKNYGIYMTTLDLRGIAKDVFARIDIPISKLDPNLTVIQIGSKVEKFTMKRWEQVAKEFGDPEKVDKLYNASKLRFKRLPQIVYFGDYLEVTKDDVVMIT